MQNISENQSPANQGQEELPKRLSIAWFDRLREDVRYSVRRLRRCPGFTTAAVLTLALGIGASASIFSIVNITLLHPLPFRDAERLVMLWETHPLIGKEKVAPPDFRDWKQQNRSFDQLAAYVDQNFILLNSAGRAEEVPGVQASSDLFATLGITPMLGRSFTAAEEREGVNVAVIEHSLWLELFHGDPSAMGKPVKMNGKEYTVVGVMPPGVEMPESTEVWVPLSQIDDQENNFRAAHILNVIGRLKPGISLQHARTDMQAIVQRLQQQFPTTNAPTGFALVSLTKEVVGHVRTLLIVLSAAVGLLLLMACASVANLLLRRGISREKEMAVRLALGADWKRLLSQLVTEGLVLSFAGGAAGLTLAWNLTIALRTYAVGVIPRADYIKLDPAVLTFSLALCILTAILFGLAPGLHLIHSNIASKLKNGERTLGAGQFKLRNLIVALQIAMSFVVLVGTGLIVRSFERVLNTPLGFPTNHLLTMKISLPGSTYEKPDVADSLYKTLLMRVESLPGVEAAAIGPNLFTSSTMRVSIGGMPDPAPGHFPVAQHREVTPGYFRTMQIALISGRFLTEQDCKSGSIVVNRTLAQRYFGRKDAVGQDLVSGFFGTERYGMPIVGVVADTKDLGIEANSEPTLYRCGASQVSTLLIRTEMDPFFIANAAKEEVRNIDSSLYTGDIESMEHIVSASMSRRRFSAVLFEIFSTLAIVLAVAGLFAVISDSVIERTREVAIRIALGAQIRDVMILIMGLIARLVLVGVAIGIAASVVFTRFLGSMLYGVNAMDPLTFTVVAAVLILISVVACYIPARRAMHVDAMAALRYE
jgi:putative ABC transport system permease protein